MNLANLFNHPQFLRRVLLVDAVSCAGMGALLLAAAAPLSGVLGLPVALLQGAAAILLPFAAFVAWLARRAAMPRAAVWAVVAINALWVVESVAVLFVGWTHPTTLGVAFVLMQAAFVAVLAELEAIGLRRLPVQA
ncbi:hypothetical protein [Tahibacter soli]|jgi:hypothetical protein|uniref:Uncharacterized protein n=1 Tax=Tahibacter soli TaxID=2983605 RepID=A0A9X3YIT0_9GAMM|nr:hypothetical protein [Tahibacter soli]MDC8013012.1 hypothetical protein [Tahibacter soli]